MLSLSISVDHYRHRRAVDELPDEFARGRRRTETRTDSNHVARPLEHAIDALRVEAVSGLRFVLILRNA